MNEQAINFSLVSKGIPIPEEVSGDWSLVINGMVTRDFQHRWGRPEVEAWLDGTEYRALQPARAAAIQQSPDEDAGVSFLRQGLHDAARAGHRDGPGMERGRQAFRPRTGDRWIKNQLSDQQLTSILLDIAQDPELESADQKLSAALLAFSPDLPLIYKSQIITPEWLVNQVWKVSSCCARVFPSGINGYDPTRGCCNYATSAASACSN